MPLSVIFFAHPLLLLFKWRATAKQKVEAKAYANQTLIFIINCVKMPKASLSLSMRRCLQVYS